MLEFIMIRDYLKDLPLHSGITVQLDTMVLGAIGFMRIRNKSAGTLVNLIFTLLTLGHNFFFRLEALPMPGSSRRFQ